MGLLALGTPLSWPEAKEKADQVREWGIQQLLATFARAKDKEDNPFLWGDEIEYLVVCFDDENRKVRLSLRQADILQALAENEQLKKQGGGVPDLEAGTDKTGQTAPTFHPEFGRFMLEATPGKPWSADIHDLLDVEPNMKWRREIARNHMASTEQPLTLTTFPLLGLPDTLIPDYKPSGDKLRSQFLPDEIANPHIRFPTLAANIRERRGRKVEINVPAFKDEKTPWPFQDPTVDYDLHNWPEDDDPRNGAAKENHIYMDAMAFGMGSCCLQVTFQASDIGEGKKMYDQLSPLGSIMLALTAATPIYKGFLADTDVRWNQISAAVDDRTKEELGESTDCKPLKARLQRGKTRIPKSRYASNSTYLASRDPRLREEYLDPDLVFDEDIKARLQKSGMDDLVATHFAHLFIRDPIVIFAEDLETLDLEKADHFENLQSTNWQHMRFKPPPPGSDIGWRVEFRSMEIQMTDFENAAFTIFIVLMTRAILSLDLNFYLPIPRTTENMATAHRRDAVVGKEKFWFRKDPLSGVPKHGGRAGSAQANGVNGHASSSGDREEQPLPPVEDEYELMTISEIMNGQEAAATSNPPPHSPTAPSPPQPSTNGHVPSPQANGTTTSSTTTPPAQPQSFPGLLPLLETYLNTLSLPPHLRHHLTRYLSLLRHRASGHLLTPATWIRQFVRSHPEYERDSKVGQGVAYDLCKAVLGMNAGERDERDERGRRVGWEILGDLADARTETEAAEGTA